MRPRGGGVICGGIVVVLLGIGFLFALYKSSISSPYIGLFLVLVCLGIIAAGLDIIVEGSKVDPDPPPRSASAASVLCGKAAEGAAPLSLSCATGTFSGVEFAGYGEVTGSCTSSFGMGSCASPNALTAVRVLCVGKSACQVPTTSDFFAGDPCPYRSKSVGVLLRGCSPSASPSPSAEPSAAPNSLVCGAVDAALGEGDGGGSPRAITLACPKGFTGVAYASFGALNGSCEDGYAPTNGTSCVSPVAFVAVRTLCLGATSCVIPATNEFFGGDPCKGARKTLAVSLSCPADAISAGPGGGGSVGLGAGAIAGAVIGTLLAVVLLAVLGVFVARRVLDGDGCAARSSAPAHSDYRRNLIFRS
jgi:hypothetical protein